MFIDADYDKSEEEITIKIKKEEEFIDFIKLNNINTVFEREEDFFLIFNGKIITFDIQGDMEDYYEGREKNGKRTKKAILNLRQNFDKNISENNPYEYINQLGKRFYRNYDISEETDIEEINNIYKELSKILHPDTNQYVDPEIMKKLNIAYKKIKEEKP